MPPAARGEHVREDQGRGGAVTDQVRRAAAEIVVADEFRLAREQAMAEDTEPVEDTYSADKEALDELKAAWDAKQITMAEYVSMRKPVMARIEAADRAADHRHYGIAVQSVARYIEQWDSLQVDQQRAMLKRVVKSITVQRGPLGTRLATG